MSDGDIINMAGTPMTLTINLPPQVEQEYRAQAMAKGVGLDEFLCALLAANQSASASPGEPGKGLFGSPEDAALLDEVVAMAYENRRRPSVRG